MPAEISPSIEDYRVTSGPVATSHGSKDKGFFFIPCDKTNTILRVMFSTGDGWEHVSVSLEDRTPSWEEMCFIKDLFWNPEDTVIQYHPRNSEYVNTHEYCLHLWRPTRQKIICPPRRLVGGI